MRTVVNASDRFRPVAAPAGEWLTVNEVAALMRCGRTTVFGLISSGTLPSIKPGRARLIRRSDVDAHLENLAAR